MLLTIIDRKLSYHGLELKKVNTYKVKASQYNHIDEGYIKKKLSKRWQDLGETKVQRDLYSAFLIMNVNEDSESINNEGCHQSFDRFIELHNKEIQRLRGQKISLALRNVM